MRQPSSKSAQGGVALIEAMVAIFIFSIGVLAVIGMQAVSIRTVADAKYRADAAFLADQIIGRIWVDQANRASYVTGGAPPAPPAVCAPGSAVATGSNIASWLNTVAGNLPGAAPNMQRIVIDGNRQVTVTICWQVSPGSPDYHNHVVTARIQNNS